MHARYGESPFLHDLSFSVATGEGVTLLGRNGAGRMTTLRAIMAVTGTRPVPIKLNGVEAIQMLTCCIVHLGLGCCP